MESTNPHTKMKLFQEPITGTINFPKAKKKHHRRTKRQPFQFDSTITSPPHDGNSNELLMVNWGLPRPLTLWYKSKNITELFPWQAECLRQGNVLDGQNLIYSAPTSAGKTLVAEILLYKHLLERRKKALIVLPLVALTREKMNYLKPGLKKVRIRVDAFAGSVNPRGGFDRVDVAVCTIEKANSIVNRLIEENKLEKVGIIVVDELHMIGDEGRGHLLELLLTKVKYLSDRNNLGIQIVGMSATLPNLDFLAKWLQAELYITHYRPVPLSEKIAIGNIIYNVKDMSEDRRLDVKDMSLDNITKHLAIEAFKDKHGALIFCQTKKLCESLANNISTQVYKLGCLTSDSVGSKLRSIITENTSQIKEMLEQLKSVTGQEDKELARTVKFGVAFHHAGLTLDERNIIESAFRSGVLKVLCATTTLAAGVNLPARLVIVRSPFNFKNDLLDVLTYNQMIGRAGRKGIDTMGESILVCDVNDRHKAMQLTNEPPKPIESCLVAHRSSPNSSPDSLKSKWIVKDSALSRAILEIIANGAACNLEDVHNYIKCTLFASNNPEDIECAIEEVVEYLKGKNLLHDDLNESEKNSTRPTQLGKAVLASAVSPDEGLYLFEELKKARASICLSNDLHLLYQVTPTNISYHVKPDWTYFMEKIWNKLDDEIKFVGKLIGVTEAKLMMMIRGHNQHEILLKRFYMALALFDLVHEKSMAETSSKFKVDKGQLQSLQQQAGSYAGMITVFCNRLGWFNMESLFEQFQSRLQFGIQRELIDLMRIKSLTTDVARHLFKCGFDKVATIATIKPKDMELHLLNSGPFQKDKSGGDSLKVVWVGEQSCAMNEKEMAKAIVAEARELVQKDLGLTIEKWTSAPSSIDSGSQGSRPDLIIDTGDEFEMDVDDMDIDYSKIFPIERHKLSPTIEDNQQNVVIPNIDQSPILSSASTSNQLNTTQSMPLVSSTPRHLFHPTKITSNDDQAKPGSGFTIIKLKEVSMRDASNSFGNSLDNISYDRLVRDAETACHSNDSQQISPSKPLIEPSTSFELSSTNICFNIEVDEQLEGSFKSAKLDHPKSSKRSSSSPGLTPNAKRLSKGLSGDSSIDEEENEEVKENLSLTPEGESSDDGVLTQRFHQDTHNWDSTDSDETSINLTNLDRTPSLETLKSIDSPAPFITKFNGVSVDGKITHTVISESTGILYDTLINKWSVKDNFAILFTTEEIAEKMTKRPIGSKIKTLTTTFADENLSQLSLRNKKITSLSVCFNGESNVYYISSPDVLLKIKHQLKNIIQSNVQIITFNIFITYQIFISWLNFDTKFLIEEIDWFDPRIAHWMLKTESEAPVNVESLIKIHQIYYMHHYSDANQIITQCVSTCLLFSLMNELNQQLDSEKLYTVYKNVEVKSRLVLAQMELNGVGVDTEYIHRQQAILCNVEEQLKEKAFKLAGQKFSLSKPKEVAKILYGKLNLLSHLYPEEEEKLPNRAKRSVTESKKRKLPKNLGTSKPVLKRLQTASKHPILEVIMDYRRVTSAIDKAIEPILKYSKRNDELEMFRVHCLCEDWQSTGRVCVADPNLICINKEFTVKDVTFEDDQDSSQSQSQQSSTSKASTTLADQSQGIAFSLRKVLIPSQSYVLVSADYSQLELRIMAHMSGDRDLQTILNDGGDVFKNIASSWKIKSIEDVTKDERQQAKQICYGMIYGIGSKSLSEALGVTIDEAKEFKESFINRFSNIKKFINETHDKCRENGFVTTMNGRRRYLPKIYSSSSKTIAEGERQAVNSTIQGSAADVLKLALVSVQKMIMDNQDSIQARFILQMHDEIMCEVHEKNVDTFVSMMRERMESCGRKFYLPVKVKVGPNWGDLEERE